MMGYGWNAVPAGRCLAHRARDWYPDEDIRAAAGSAGHELRDPAQVASDRNVVAALLTKAQWAVRERNRQREEIACWGGQRLHPAAQSRVDPHRKEPWVHSKIAGGGGCGREPEEYRM